ncbi:FKBP-type peptidyl-prolyl cis-trans isomerase [Ornithinimicrobium ciconiae]|uniref:peptidylprolyl isomerase n=1 Tax=Ornithinimicrobium ciconiae TaxID=2594265 RepID=A0A516GBM6_9MICO|nr:FKBP-type peptidyl-prolyl cis-trans isomerase [Ornithinimicrobium ciconiae]QDO88760.1 FKBP-type peptidyl-prolyl cis-trans isomerase [Ornithinimicrobium ciconiae]
MRSPKFRLLGLAVAPLIFLSACGDDTSTDDASQSSAPGDDAAATSLAPNGTADDVTLTEADVDGTTVPALELGKTPLAVGETSIQEIEAGEGEPATAEQDVELKYLAVNGTTGEEILTTFPTDETVSMSLANPNLLPGFLNSLEGTKPGQSFIIAMSPEDAFGTQGNMQLGIGPNDTVVFYVEVVGATTPLTQAEGEEVEPVEGLPTVEADGTSPATVTIPEGEDPPTELVVQPLIKGEGEEIQAGQQVRMQYTGVQWSDGEQFDTSLQEGRDAFETVIGQGQVIQGWDEGLVGQTVGSRVLLVIPPELAYGDAQEGGPGAELKDETLVFVVDILKAQ